jgi:muramoyltetrapeptide carboxypeptidase LdcA involved in peptidoglycan recycling
LVDGVGWGGNLETLAELLMAGGQIRPNSAYAGCVLFLETSEELPTAGHVHRVLRGMGERGLLQQFAAVLVGRAKSWSFDQPHTPGQAAAYRADQHDAVLRALAQYAPGTMAVLDVDLGHTDPQLIIPYGGRIHVDGPGRRISVTY